MQLLMNGDIDGAIQIFESSRNPGVWL